MSILLQVFAAYIIADILSGVYHFLTDNGYNPIKSQVENFQWHHEHPDKLPFDFRPMLGGVPAMFVALFGWYPFFWLALGIFSSCIQFTHYYTHHPAPAPIAFLQRCGIILSVKHHNGHHSADHNKNYCILSGWNNWWFNKLVRKKG